MTVAGRWDEGMSVAERQLAFAMASQDDGAIVNVHEHADEARRVFRGLQRAGLGIVSMESIAPKVMYVTDANGVERKVTFVD